MPATCPRCQRNTLENPTGLNALSRKDNETYVCSPCGEDEAILDFITEGRHSWPRKGKLLTFDDLFGQSIRRMR